MSKVLVVGHSAGDIAPLARALVERGDSVLSLSPGDARAADSDWDHQVADPGTAIGRGLLGDLYRQRGPFATVIHVLSDVAVDGRDASPFTQSGLDRDLMQLNRELATFLALSKSAVALSEPGVTLLTLRVNAGSSAENSALGLAADAFMVAFHQAAEDGSTLKWHHAALAAADLEADPGAVLATFLS